MSISPPHGQIYEESEFWFDPNEKALLYEIKVRQETGEAIPDHKNFAERGFPIGDLWHEHRPVHYQPHGISFKDATARSDDEDANVANTELVVRLWYQIENNEQPIKTGHREPLIPVPKALALFLAAKLSEMHREESLTQAIALLHTYITAKVITQTPPHETQTAR